MKPKNPPSQKQTHLLYQDLLEQLNPKDPLLLLAGKLSGKMLEREFTPR